MNILDEDKDNVFCIGKTDEFAQFMTNNCVNDKTTEYVLCESVHLLTDEYEKRILLLNTDISDIPFCILNDCRELSFYHNGFLISETEPDLLYKVEKDYLNNHSYKLLKQLNVIRLIFDLRRKNVILSSYPLHMQIEHTTFCDARCIMCDHFIAHNRGSKHLTLNMIESMRSVFPYVSMVIMHGNGEPLLNPEILPILDFYREYSINTSLNTNLSYLSDDILSSMRDNCKSIHVSCDGIGREQYESVRLGLSYSGFISNMKKLAAVCNKTEKILEVVLMRQNITDAEKFVRFAYDYGFSKVIFNALGCNKWIGNQKDGIQEYRSVAVYYCSRAKSEGACLGVSVVTPFENAHEIQPEDTEHSLPPQKRSRNMQDSESLHKKYPWYTNTIAVKDLDTSLLCRYDGSDIRGVCEHPFAKTYVDLCGNVSFCCHLSRQRIDTLTEEKSFESIWNGETYQKMRSLFYKNGLPELCRKCFQLNNHSLKFLDASSVCSGE